MKEGHLRRYVKEIDQRPGLRQGVDRIAVRTLALPEPRPTINFILGDPFDDQYQTKRQEKKLLRAPMIKAKVKAIHTRSSCVETELIDSLISFPPVNPNRVIVPHYDALVLTLCINGFDVHKVPVDLGSVADLL